jgi:hypothetical protein
MAIALMGQEDCRRLNSQHGQGQTVPTAAIRERLQMLTIPGSPERLENSTLDRVSQPEDRTRETTSDKSNH